VTSSDEDAALCVLSPFHTAVMLYVFAAFGNQRKENVPLCAARDWLVVYPSDWMRRNMFACVVMLMLPKSVIESPNVDMVVEARKVS